MKKQPKAGKVIKAKNMFGYFLISIALVFIVFYVIDGLKELIYPLKSFAFPYKSLPFYFLKLFYAILLIAGGYLLCKRRAYCWHIFQFASIGILTSSFLFYFGGYVFRSSILDLFMLEFVSSLLLLVINTRRIAEVFDIIKPNNWPVITAFFVIFNFILNFCFWHLSAL
jgi:hypothetical protein